MKIKLRMRRSLLLELRHDLARPHPFAFERVGFLACRVAESKPRSLIVFPYQYLEVQDDDYLSDISVGAMMGPKAIRKALQFAYNNDVAMFHVHMHDHNGRPWFSDTDVRETSKFVPDFWHVRPTFPHGALLLSRDSLRPLLDAGPKKTISDCWFQRRWIPDEFHSRVVMSDWLLRQNFLGENSDEVFWQCRVAVIGLGGGGSHVVQQLAHLGVGNFVLLDPDHVEDTNLNRLVGATKKDVARATLKTSVAGRLIKGINPNAQVLRVPKEWQKEGKLVAGCDIVFGCVDSYLAREEIERLCRRFLIPFIDIGMDVKELSDGYVISGQVILSMPNDLCMRCLGFFNEELLAQEAARYGAAGGRPQVVWPNGILASSAVGTFVQLVTPWRKNLKPSLYLEYDGNTQAVMPSNRLQHLVGKQCTHFPLRELGDPFWR